MSEPAAVRPAPTGSVGDTDSVATSTGVVSESEHESLRADIRRLSTMLGRTLAHHGGPELLELVEEVRRLSRQAPESGGAEITNLLAGLDTGTAVALTRAFSQYFQLANTAEQLHRSRELRTLRPAERRPLRDAHAAPGRGVPRRGARRGAGRAGTSGAAAGVHRAPDRVVAAVGAADTAPGRRGARPRGGRRRGRRARRPAVADRRDPPGQADGRRRGERHRLVPGAARAQHGARARRRVRARGPGGRVHCAGGRAAARARVVGRRRPRRQPVRHSAGHPRGRRAERGPGAADPPAVGRAAGRRAVDLDPGRRRLRGAARLASPRPPRAARGVRPLHPAQLQRALPAQALLRPRPPGGHPRAHPRRRRARSRTRLPGMRRSTSRTCRCSTAHCARTSVGGSPTAHWPAHCGRPRRSACTWRSWTSASTAASTTRRSGRSTTHSASWTSPTPSWIGPSAPPCWAASWSRGARSFAGTTGCRTRPRTCWRSSTCCTRCSTSTAARCAAPTSSRCARASTTCSPSPCSPARRTWSSSNRTRGRRSTSCRCSRRSRSCRRPVRCSTSCSRCPATASRCATGATCKRSCWATPTRTSSPGSPPRSGRSTGRSASCATSRPSTGSGCDCSTAAAGRSAGAAGRRARRSWPPRSAPSTRR